MAKIKKTGRHTSAIKAARQAVRRKIRNQEKKEGIKTIFKQISALAESKDKAKAKELLKTYMSRVDKAAKAGIYHWRAAGRKKASIARLVGSISNNGSAAVAAA
ncbi:MAG: 30S ribosomal protein S20 [Elusimicrobia bacterium]|nr:30S ribosomal protein S20 [Elusimicrobiota bacterium]